MDQGSGERVDPDGGHARRRLNAGFLQETHVQRHAAHVGRRYPVDERGGTLGQDGGPERHPDRDAAEQPDGAGQVGQRREGDGHQDPGPLGRLQRWQGVADLGQLGQQEVVRAGQRGDGQQGPRPHPLHADQLRAFHAAGRGGRGPGPGQQAVLLLDGAAGASGQGQRLQQRHRRRHPLGAQHLDRGGYGPVLADQGGQRREQFRHVQVHLPPRGGQLGEAEVGDHGLAGLVDHARSRPAASGGRSPPCAACPPPPTAGRAGHR